MRNTIKKVSSSEIGESFGTPLVLSETPVDFRKISLMELASIPSEVPLKETYTNSRKIALSDMTMSSGTKHLCIHLGAGDQRFLKADDLVGALIRMYGTSYLKKCLDSLDGSSQQDFGHASNM